MKTASVGFLLETHRGGGAGTTGRTAGGQDGASTSEPPSGRRGLPHAVGDTEVRTASPTCLGCSGYHTETRESWLLSPLVSVSCAAHCRAGPRAGTYSYLIRPSGFPCGLGVE